VILFSYNVELALITKDKTGKCMLENGTRVATAAATVCSQDESFAAGESIARQLQDPALRGVLLLSDGLNVNGSELVRGLNLVLANDVVVTGGLAGDGSRFQRTWVVHEGDARSNMVCAAGLYGDHVTIGHGSKGGWDNFGPERRVTRSVGNVLIELDGRPALELYKEYLGELASGLPATGLLFPLALRANATDEKSLVRTILAVDEAAQTVTFAGDFYDGGDWLYGGEKVKGDLWGCVGAWYSGDWYDPGARQYIAEVKALLAKRPWRGWQ